MQPKARHFDAVFERRHYKDILRQNLFTEHDESSTILFGNRSSTPDFSPTVQHEGLSKRAFDFRYYVCKGGVQWAKIQEVSKGTPPSGPLFSDEDLQDGWSKDDKDKPDFIAWTTPLQDLVGRRPTRSDMQFIKLRQDKAFHNAAGELVQVSKPPPVEPAESLTCRFSKNFFKEAIYFVTYLPSFSAIVVSNVKSPRNQLEQKYPGPLHLSNDDIAKRIPKLNRFSDVIWKVWTQLVHDPEKLRYIAHDFVVNDVTVDVMNHIFGARYRGEKSVPWPGMKFGLESDEGKALLASPNGVGTFWLLLDRAAKLGRRKLEVTIFSEKDGAYHYCMLWDLSPA